MFRISRTSSVFSEPASLALAAVRLLQVSRQESLPRVLSVEMTDSYERIRFLQFTAFDGIRQKKTDIPPHAD
jgi:hypothetical protein